MTSVFTEDGRYVPVTVIAAGPCTVVERKTKEKHGYDAVALGFEPVKRQPRYPRARRTLQEAGRWSRLRFVREFRDEPEGEPGQSVTVTGFEPGDRVDVVGISKGHGFSGGIKRHNFSGGGASHGSMIHRQPASQRRHQRRPHDQRKPPPGPLRRRPHDAAEPRSRPRGRRAQSAARARRGSRGEERAWCSCARASRRARLNVMPNVSTRPASRSRSAAPVSSSGISTRSSTSSIAPSIASSRTRAPARPRPRSATRSRAADASRGARRAPAARARDRFVRRNGGTAASCSGRSRASFVESLNKKERRLAFMAALADRFRNGAVTLLDAERLQRCRRPRASRSCSSAAQRRRNAALRR